MARPYVTGPAHIWVGFYGENRSNSTSPGQSTTTDDPQLKFGNLAPQRPRPFYLGTCEVAPLIDIDNGWAPVFTSDTGIVKPRQHTFEGDSGLIVAPLNRYNESIYEAVASKTQVNVDNPRGSWRAEDVGALSQSEEFGSMMLWVVFPFFDTPYLPATAPDPDFPPCYRFPQAYLYHADKLTGLDSAGRLTTLAWYAVAQRIAPGEAEEPLNIGDWLLYDHQLFDVPTFPAE